MAKNGYTGGTKGPGSRLCDFPFLTHQRAEKGKLSEMDRVSLERLVGLLAAL